MVCWLGMAAAAALREITTSSFQGEHFLAWVKGSKRGRKEAEVAQIVIFLELRLLTAGCLYHLQSF